MGKLFFVIVLVLMMICFFISFYKMINEKSSVLDLEEEMD